MADVLTITLEAVECVRIYREARVAHLDAAGDGAGEPARRLDELIDAVEVAGDPRGALTFGLLGSILTAGDEGERVAALGFLAGLPTGQLLMAAIGRASRYDPRERVQAFRDAARPERAGYFNSTFPGPGRD